MELKDYPWYAPVSNDDLEQGDILESCTVFMPPDELVRGESTIGAFEAEQRDLVVVTQSCDLVLGREKVSDVICCGIWETDQFETGHLATAKGLEEVRRGFLPSYHMLAACTVSGFERTARIIDFRQLYSLPLPLVRREAAQSGERLRLLPPYREHLAQAFARYFMRIGLPLDIPPFR
ncbi:MAG TPA: hypothetical protein VN641_09885 [Urbifossiella sp.]|nr:hypothetical protein [Urbifossiella sp.]